MPPRTSCSPSPTLTWAASTPLPCRPGNGPGSGSSRSWPSRPGPQDHLHHQRDRVAELPAPQDHQEPRPLPRRRRRRQAPVAAIRDIEDKRARARAAEKGMSRDKRKAPARFVEGAVVQNWKTSPRRPGPALPRPARSLHPLATQDQLTQTTLTSPRSRLAAHACQGQRDDRRLSGTRETHVVWLITQRPMVASAQQSCKAAMA